MDGCPKRGVTVTVYGLNPWNSMLTFGVAAGPVPNKTELHMATYSFVMIVPEGVPWTSEAHLGAGICCACTYVLKLTVTSRSPGYVVLKIRDLMSCPLVSCVFSPRFA
jgi:hypothetical protein